MDRDVPVVIDQLRGPVIGSCGRPVSLPVRKVRGPTGTRRSHRDHGNRRRNPPHVRPYRRAFMHPITSTREATTGYKVIRHALPAGRDELRPRGHDQRLGQERHLPRRGARRGFGITSRTRHSRRLRRWTSPPAETIPPTYRRPYRRPSASAPWRAARCPGQPGDRRPSLDRCSRRNRGNRHRIRSRPPYRPRTAR